MFTLGIDIGKSYHAAALIDPAGKTVALLSSFPAHAAGFQKLLTFLRQYLPDAPADLRVGMEATGPYWTPLSHWLTNRGFEVVVLNPLKTASLRNYGIRGSKTDRLDAVLIAQALRWEGLRPTASLPTELRELRSLTRLRSEVVRDRSRATLRLGSLLSSLFPEFHTLFPKLASPSALAVLDTAPTPARVLALGASALAKILHTASRGKLGTERAQQLLEAASASVGVPSPTLECALPLLVAQVHLFDDQIKILEKEIIRLYKAAGLPPLESLPGSRLLLAATYAAEIGSISRFRAGKQLVAFAGIDPKLRQSGQFSGQVRMSKRGSPYLRHAVYVACLSAVRCDDHFKTIYERQLARGKPKRKALGAVMNHFVHVLYAIWRDNRAYTPLTPA